MIATLGLAFLAGVLSILNPCVLPILPAVLGGAASEHRLGPLALAGGLTLSFTLIGLFVATVGFAAGLDAEVFRAVAAVLLIAVGAVLVLPALQVRLAVAAGPAVNAVEQRLAAVSTGGIGGQFALGLILGAIWVPCVGPTLGAASVLAARGDDIGTVALTMLAFGLGAALPLALLGAVSREVLLGWRGHLARAGKGLRAVLGAALILVGALILSGADKRLEATLVEAAPEWLVDLTTRF
jgi:cytochrome c biogenesis protein CcdA